MKVSLDEHIELELSIIIYIQDDDGLKLVQNINEKAFKEKWVLIVFILFELQAFIKAKIKLTISINIRMVESFIADISATLLVMP